MRGALNPHDAASYLGVTKATFYRHVVPKLKRVEIGRVRVYPVKELDRYLDSMTE